VDDYGPALVLNLQYHTNFPSATDPFYLAAPTENTGRATYYLLGGVPGLYTDGAEEPPPGDHDGLVSVVGNRLATPSPLEIDVAANIVGTDITVYVDVTAVDDVPASGLVLRIALVEPYVGYGTPPGANGEVDFFRSLRDMLPDHAGTPFTITNGQTLNFSENGTLDPSWTDVYAVAWVQNDTDQEVLQAGSSLAPPSFAFFFGCHDPAAVAPLGNLHGFESLNTNVGSESDMYNIHIEKDIPVSWAASVCANGTCYPPWITDFTMELNAGQQDTILVDIQPLGEVGSGTVTLTATSMSDPGLEFSQTFKVVSNLQPVLVVDDDGGQAYEAYYTQAIDAAGYANSTWDLDTDGKLAADELDYFQTVVWNIGEQVPSVDEDDRAALGSYLDNGGKLFITGQNIGFDLCDLTSENYSPAALAWYQNYLGAEYIDDDTDDLTIDGVPGDPIGDGLSFAISGGTGANNQLYPSEIEPIAGGIACLTYSAGIEAGVHLDTGTYQTCYFAFGFEGIAEQADRELVMLRVLEWLDVVIAVPDEQLVEPLFRRPAEAFPNPFNPSTRIEFEIGGSVAVPAAVTLFDLRGRKIRTLHEGTLQPGPQSFLWNGRDDSGGEVASGVYLARITVADLKQSLKITLAK